jgi:multidrug transporter EmrE-like cation transporter
MGYRIKVHGRLFALVSIFDDGRGHGAEPRALGLALKSLPVGTAYAVWTGIGAVGTATLGIVLFSEPATVSRLVCIGLIVCGIAGLKFAS